MDELSQMYIGGLLTGAILYFAAQMVMLTIKLDIDRGKQAVLESSHKTQAVEDGPRHQKLEEQILQLHEMAHLQYIQMQEIVDLLTSQSQSPSEIHFDSELRRLVADACGSSQSSDQHEEHCSKSHESHLESDAEPQHHSASPSN